MHARPLLQELLQVFDREVGYSRVLLEQYVVGIVALHFNVVLCPALLLGRLFTSWYWFYVFLALDLHPIVLIVLASKISKF